MAIMTFGQMWAKLQWEVMQATGKGYQRPSLRNAGVGKDRRKDKLDHPGVSKHMRGYQKRYQKV